MLVSNRAQIEGEVVAQLGAGDLLAPGITLYDINFGLGSVNVEFPAATTFRATTRANRMYCKSTQPSFLGSGADPAFEVHFDCVLTGTLTLPSAPGQRPRASNVSASVPRLEVKPRNVVGGAMTTVAALFQQTRAGRIALQSVVRNAIEPRLADAVNNRLRLL